VARAGVLVVGGGTGGVAAALAAAESGQRVILTEATDWLGGQLTSQAVPPDEHPWIEQCGCTARYRRFRDLVRQYYRNHYPLTATARGTVWLNPGGGGVSRLCHEPRVAAAVLDQMVAWHATRGQLDVRRRCLPIAATTHGDRITSVEVLDLDSGQREVLTADLIIDATELGDLLALAAVEHVSGAESQSETGEPHAVSGEPQPANLQSLTWCFAMGYEPGADHRGDPPAGYARWRSYVPALRPPWPGRLLDWTYTHPITLEPITKVLLPSDTPDDPYRSLWYYRRLVCRDHYAEAVAPHEVTLVNWPQNDYLEGLPYGPDPAAVARCLAEARELSLSLFYWLQTEAPRPDGGCGYPGLYLRPDITGTRDGLAKAPYIRESRRLRALFTVTENHVGRQARGSDRAAWFADSVGVGCYRIDLHPSTGGDNYVDVSSLPFQIPLGALVPVRVENLLAGAKNIGTTHVSNGCYRLHPVEWGIGEAAGSLAAFCVERHCSPQQVHQSQALTEAFQQVLRRQGVELSWPDLHPV
jgi:hypothetical protein